MDALRRNVGKGAVVGVAALAVALALSVDGAGTAAEHEHEDTEVTVAMASDVDACTLVTQDEAQAAMAAEVSPVPDAAQCTYVAGDGSGRGLSVAVPATFGAQESAQPGMQQVADVLHGDLTVLSDVGDEGYVVTSPNIAQLMARQGDDHVVLVLTMPAGEPAQQVSLLADLARTALGRM